MDDRSERPGGSTLELASIAEIAEDAEKVAAAADAQTDEAGPPDLFAREGGSSISSDSSSDDEEVPNTMRCQQQLCCPSCLQGH